MKIYVASSWRNAYQPGVVRKLREAGYEVYDFRNPQVGTPAEGNGTGFRWSQIDTWWQSWSMTDYRKALRLDPRARQGFDNDFSAMKNCDTCVLVLPCGRSAHLEAGWFAGAGKQLHIYIPEPIEPELMYSMGCISLTMPELLVALLATSIENAT